MVGITLAEYGVIDCKNCVYSIDTEVYVNYALAHKCIACTANTSYSGSMWPLVSSASTVAPQVAFVICTHPCGYFIHRQADRRPRSLPGTMST